MCPFFGEKRAHRMTAQLWGYLVPKFQAVSVSIAHRGGNFVLKRSMLAYVINGYLEETDLPPDLIITHLLVTTGSTGGYERSSTKFHIQPLSGLGHLISFPTSSWECFQLCRVGVQSFSFGTVPKAKTLHSIHYKSL